MLVNAQPPRQGPDGVIRPLKDRLRTLCKQRRIRLHEFFKPFDVHHNKKVNGHASPSRVRRRRACLGESFPPAGRVLVRAYIDIVAQRKATTTLGIFCVQCCGSVRQKYYAEYTVCTAFACLSLWRITSANKMKRLTNLQVDVGVYHTECNTAHRSSVVTCIQFAVSLSCAA